MKTKEQAKKQVERILWRLVEREDAKLFEKIAKRLLNYVHSVYC